MCNKFELTVSLHDVHVCWPDQVSNLYCTKK